MGGHPAADGFQEHGHCVGVYQAELSRRNSKPLLWIGNGKPSGAGSNTPSGV